MARFFNQNGIASCAVVSGYPVANAIGNDDTSSYVLERKKAVKMLKDCELKVIFSVDIFNEGVDIQELDMVMFLRPTESSTVFLQQLGRGLRKKQGKTYVNVLDFIGSYKKANLIPFFLAGDIKVTVGSPGSSGVRLPKEEDYPDGCYIDLGFHLVDLFKKMVAEQKSLFDKIVDEYMWIKVDYKDRPLMGIADSDDNKISEMTGFER
ncbi:MAG TPA: helicase-related protein [Bacillota bacterium]|nr:helicase-related protein [Bacillota bacterium]